MNQLWSSVRASTGKVEYNMGIVGYNKGILGGSIRCIEVKTMNLILAGIPLIRVAFFSIAYIISIRV